MFTAMEMTTCPNLAVPAEVMQYVVQVESGSNPFAIGVVGGQLVRQPASLDEALATVLMLDAKGYDYSLGMAQVNRRNLGRYGLDTYEKAFDPCANVAAGAQILAQCYGRSGNDWGKAFSCYYSGNFVTGYRDGYVQKVYASMQGTVDTSSAAVPIALNGTAAALEDVASKRRRISDSSNYRVAIRSVVFGAAANAAVSAVTQTADAATPAARPPAAALTSPASSNVAAGTAPRRDTAAGIFEPVVRGPNDPISPPSQGAVSATSAASPATDQTDLTREQRDAAFVF